MHADEVRVVELDELRDLGAVAELLEEQLLTVDEGEGTEPGSDLLGPTRWVHRDYNKIGCMDMLYRGKWLGICVKAGLAGGEELVFRTTANKYFAGVNLFPYRRLQSGRRKVCLIENFRVPAWQYVVEIPAGLAEHGSSVEENARREAKEESGVGGGHAV